tara:strand:+ start:1213 stop:2043 length:831 start_codon:yes stop_codon:yes gene_type:complete
MKHNIFWCAGMDSTYLVCRRLIMERVPIETYYLNFPCDGYNVQHSIPTYANPETRLSSLDIENENIVEVDGYGNKSYGRLNRDVEVKVMYKLREMIIEQFPFTEELFPPLVLINSVKIEPDFLTDMQFLTREYGCRWDRAEQCLYMVQYSLQKNELFEIAYEEGFTATPGRYSPGTAFLRENCDENFRVNGDKVPEMNHYRNISIPICKVWREEMVDHAIKYNFTNILENTWSCRFPKSNGDICDDNPKSSCCHHDKYGHYNRINRKSNYNNILEC